MRGANKVRQASETMGMGGWQILTQDLLSSNAGFIDRFKRTLLSIESPDDCP